MTKSLLKGLVLAVPVVFVTGVMAQEKAATPGAAKPAPSSTSAATTAPAPATAPASSSAASAAPASTTQQEKMERFSGVIEKVDDAAKEVVVQFHKDKMDFAMNTGAKITEGKKELPFSDLKKGMWASVEYKKEGGKSVAESMSVSMPTSGKKAYASKNRAPAKEHASQMKSSSEPQK